MKFKSDIEVQAGLKDSSGAIGTSGQLLSSTATGVSWTSLNGFVPYTGAIQNVDLGIYTLLAAKGVFSSSGSANTVEIGHSSGSGIALNITKGGNGEGLYVNKTSGSGNAVTIIGTLNATTLVKSGGTAAQILAADGTVITAGTNITISGGTISSSGGVTSVAALTLGTTGTDLSSTVANPTTTPVITLNVPTASATNRGALSAADWITFNNKADRYTRTITVSNLSYTNICTVTGDSLASAIKMSFQGTNDGTVVNVTAEILVNHFQDISITSNSGLYSQINIRIVSNNNETYSIEAQINNGITSNLNIEVFPLNNESVTFQGTLVTAGTTLVHTTRTGIYITSSDNNLAAISSGGDMYAAGNIGIGTVSPSARLDVSGASPSIFISDNLGTAAEHGFQFNASGIGLRGGLTINYNTAELRHWAGISTNTYFQTFYTNGSERMRITSGGNIGIGETSPGTTTDNTLLGFVNGSNIQARKAVPQLAISSNINGEWYSPTYRVSNFATQLYLDSNQGTIALRTASSGTAGSAITWNTPAIFIQNNGNVGIGTTIPAAKLTVNGQVQVIDNSLQGFYQSRKSDTASEGVYGGNSFVLRNGSTSEDLNFDLFNRSTSAWYTPMVVKNTGNVLIGTTVDEGFRLQVSGKASINGYGLSGDFGANYNIGLGVGISGKGINMGYNNTADIGFIGVVHNGTAWKNLTLCPIGGSVYIGLSGGNGLFAGTGTFSSSVTTPEYSISGISALLHIGSYTVLRDRVGRNAIILGNTDDPSNYYDNNNHIFRNRAATVVANINSSGAATFTGSVTATGFFNSSDIRLKDVISQDGDVIRYKWKDGRDDKIHVGYSAQEVQKIMPDAVNEGTDGMLSVNYIEVLVAKIAELENRIKQLEK